MPCSVVVISTRRARATTALFFSLILESLFMNMEHSPHPLCCPDCQLTFNTVNASDLNIMSSSAPCTDRQEMVFWKVVPPSMPVFLLIIYASWCLMLVVVVNPGQKDPCLELRYVMIMHNFDGTTFTDVVNVLSRSAVINKISTEYLGLGPGYNPVC
jgi:hypothetical protein